MNVFVADPDWGWWIILYFYLGGIAAGAYFIATLIDLFGRVEDRELARPGYWIAFPLIALCGLFLTVDLGRPERFWHMLFRSEVVHEAIREGWPKSGWGTFLHAPFAKYWSPMSVGSWGLLVFGACSGLSFLGSLRSNGFLARLLRYSIFGKIIALIGCVLGFFVASYTGALLTATNQPLWSDNTWIAPLFLISSASTGMAALILINGLRGVDPSGLAHRLMRAETWCIFLELVVFAIFWITLTPFIRVILSTWQGLLLLVGVSMFGLLLPLALHWLPGHAASRLVASSVLVLIGGFVLRYALLREDEALLTKGPAIAVPAVDYERPPLISHFSPEDGRPPGQPGADPMNRSPETAPRSKVFQGD
jgi:protein NrfD